MIYGEIHPYDDSLSSTNNVQDEIPEPADKNGDPVDDNFKLDTCRTANKFIQNRFSTKEKCTY